MTRATHLLGTLLVVGAVACDPAPVALRFDGAPPDYRGSDYDRVHARWTRHFHLTRGVDTALDGNATLFSDDFRAAHRARVASMRLLTASERALLDAEDRDAAERFVEILLEVDTGQFEWNDFGSTRSLWTLTLVDDAGHELAHPEVRAPAAKKDELALLFPTVGPFTRSWVVRFARSLPDGARALGPTTRWVALRLAGPLGRTEVRWDAAQLTSSLAPERQRPPGPPTASR